MAVPYIVELELKKRVKADYQTTGEYVFTIMADSVKEAKDDGRHHMRACQGWVEEYPSTTHLYDDRKTKAALATGDDRIIDGESCNFCLRSGAIVFEI